MGFSIEIRYHSPTREVEGRRSGALSVEHNGLGYLVVFGNGPITTKIVRGVRSLRCSRVVVRVLSVCT